ncbi:MAG: hypothetical protein RIC15_10860, partial [Vicingaceae bacterium]
VNGLDLSAQGKQIRASKAFDIRLNSPMFRKGQRIKLIPPSVFLTFSGDFILLILWSAILLWLGFSS